MKKTTSRILPLYIPILFAICVAFLVANAFSFYQNLQSLAQSNNQMVKTSRAIDHLQYANVLIVDAESSTRGYFLSGNKVYLGPWKTAQEEISQEFAALRDLFKDNPQQMKNLEELRALFDQKLAMMQQSITAYDTGGLGEVIKLSKGEQDRETQDEIRLLIVIMVGEENASQLARGISFYTEYRAAVGLGMLINLGAILVLVLFYRLNRRNFYNRLAVEDELQSANENLESTVAMRTEQLSILSRHLINVSEEEKSRLARELHDELGASLTAINMDVAGVTEKLKNSEPVLAARLQRARETLLDTIDLKRRIIENLRPSMLDNLGLSASISSYCDEFTRISGIQCELDITEDFDKMDSVHNIAFFRIAQESLNNVVKYAQATKVTIRLKNMGDNLMLQIIDDGIGIAVDTLSKPKSHGLVGMRERALLLGGTFTVQRGPDNRGTVITAIIPFGY